MRPPEDRNGPAGNRAESSDLLAGDQDQTTARFDLHHRIAVAFLGELLLVSAERAAEVVREVTPAVFVSPVHQWVFRAVTATVKAGIRPSPLAVAEQAQRLGMAPPPAFRGWVVSELAEMTTDAALSLGWAVDRLRSQHRRRVAEKALRDALDVLWLGDDDEAAVAVQRQCAGAVAAMMDGAQ